MNETYCANPKIGNCASRKWKLTGISCNHVISCMWQIKKPLEDYVSDYYKYVSQASSLCFIIMCVHVFYYYAV